MSDVEALSLELATDAIFTGNRLEKERRDAEQKKRERDEQHLYLTVKVSLLAR